MWPSLAVPCRCVVGGGVLGEHHISDVVAGVFDSPVSAHVSAQVSRDDLVSVETGDGVDRFPGLSLTWANVVG